MNADHFRQLYAYHFTVNRQLWDHHILKLTDAQFTQTIPYSVGSIRDQIVHLLNIEDRWFSGLRGLEVPGFLNPVYYIDRAQIRALWDQGEAGMRVYLDELRDDHLPIRPFPGNSIEVWQVLAHVINHATDHRAQVLMLLHREFGIETHGQDLAFFLNGRLSL